MNARFGSKQVRKGVQHFLFGKVLSSVAGFIALILTVRALSIAEFASYSVLLALVEYVTALSGFGLIHIILRYVPELYGHEYDYAFKTFVRRTLILRFLSLFLLGLVAYLASDFLSRLLGDQVPQKAFEAFLIVAFVRTAGFSLAQVLDSTLSQGISQLAFIASSVTKAVVIWVLIYLGKASLINIILTEAIGDFVSLVIMAFGVFRVVNAKRNADIPEDDMSWLSNKKQGIIRYAITGYIQHLMMLPYGGQTNRLIGGNFLSPLAMASYGFAQSLYEYCKRYLPAQLLLGVIRPVIISRYAATKDFAAAVKLTESFFKVNALMIAPVLALIVVNGEELISLLSNGKYGHSASILLSLLLVLVLMETIRMQLEVLVQAVERYHYLLFANILSSCSIVPAFFLLGKYGAWLLPALNMIGIMSAIYVILMQLKKDGFLYVHDWDSTIRILISVLLAIAVGFLVKLYIHSWWLVSFFVLIGYAIAVFIFYSSHMRGLIGFMKNQRKSHA